MAKIIIQPLGLTIEAEVGETVMGAAQAHGLYWPTTCGGEGICTTCTMTVLEGGEGLSEVGRAERRTLTQEQGDSALSRGLRLACQARVVSDERTITVRKPGVRQR